MRSKRHPIPLIVSLFYIALGGCFLLTPDDPPPEPKALHPDDYVWERMDLATVPEYFPDQPFECGTVQMLLSSSGRCSPVKLPFAAGVECPLAYPAETLLFACIRDASPMPAVYVRMKWSDNARNIDLYEKLGTCRMEQAGPAAGEAPRFNTDPGYRACLFEPSDKAGHAPERERPGLEQNDSPHGQPVTPRTPAYAMTKGTLRGPDAAPRPAGLYLDFAGNPETTQKLENSISLKIFSAPATLVLDARFLDEEEREQAFKDVIAIFDAYRNQQSVLEIK